VRLEADVGATKRHRPRRKLPWIAAGLSALAAGRADAQSNLDFRYLYYQESNGRTKVLNPWINLHQDFGLKGGALSLLLGYDTISGASPTGGYPTADATTSASGVSSSNSSIPQVAYHDTRKSATLGYVHKFGAHLPSIDISYSKENDYVARNAGLSDAWTLAHGRGTLHFGVSIGRDIVTPVITPTIPARLDHDKSSDGFALGWSWIAGERDLLDVSASLTKLSGYLTDPYKIVPITTGAVPEVPEQRPDSRSRRAVLFKYGHYFDEANGALKTTFRYYWDDWAIRAYTLDLLYDAHVGSRWIVSPQLRLYSQSSASFFAYEFAAPQVYMSSDYRLSAFDSVLGGLALSYRFPHDLTASLGVTYQSQRGRDRVVPRTTAPPPPVTPLTPLDDGEGEGGSALVSSADMTVMAWTFGLTWRY
jgi:hypothetical protein